MVQCVNKQTVILLLHPGTEYKKLAHFNFRANSKTGDKNWPISRTGYQFQGKFFSERGANLESRAAHTHLKNTQVPPRRFYARRRFLSAHIPHLLNAIFINIGNTLHWSDVNEQHSSLTTLMQLKLKNMQENIENIKVCVCMFIYNSVPTYIQLYFSSSRRVW